MSRVCSRGPISAPHFYSVEEKTDYKYAYNAYGVGCTEVEIDVLTGELQILRVDILYDCGDR